MKAKYLIPALAMALAGVAFSSCSDMLSTDTESFVDVDGLGTYNANDSLYSAMGVVTQLQKLGERYVLLGELRGDLVEVPSSAPYDLQEISRFEMSASNAYSAKRDYYAVINNCNFALTKLDTLITEHNQKVLLPEYVSIRAMRDWTYLQLGLTFGKAQWIDRPLLSLEETDASFETLELDALMDRLINDLTPFADSPTANYGSVDGKQSSRFFMSPKLLLADMLLYKNRYEAAAALYYDYIYKNEVRVMSTLSNQWETSQANSIKQTNHTQSYLSEALCMIPYSSDAKKYHPNLVNMTYHQEPQILPAAWWMADMNSRMHFFAQTEEVPTYSLLEGDTRGEMVNVVSNVSQPDAFSSKGVATVSTPSLITKFLNNGTENSTVKNPGNVFFETGNQVIVEQVATYRIPQLYLRYAEAVNRAGKPSLAFAVIKYGLRNDVINNETAPKVAAGELTGEAWINFNDSRFDDNRGIASRGRGYGVANASEYAIPEFAAKSDSITWVEGQLLEEMAAETAFEGNRFFDLLRVSRHNSNPEEWFAAKVSRRFENPSAAASVIANPANRWLK